MVRGSSSTSFKIVPAVEKAIQILQCFKDGEEEYGPAELGRILNANRSTIFHILRTLEHYGLLQRNESTKKFRLGYSLLDLGNVVLRRMDLRTIAKPMMQELVDETGETVLLTILDGQSVMVVGRVESRRRVRTTSSVGARLPVSATADGKVFLAWAADSVVDAVLGPGPLRRFTEVSITDAEAFKRELARVREQGYGVDDEEYSSGVRGISAPVRDFRGKVVAAITLAGFGISDERLPELIDKVVSTAAEVSQRLGATASGR